MLWASQAVLVVKNPPTNAGDTRDTGLIHWSGISPGVGNSTTFQYACLENSMDRVAWQAIVHGAAKSLIQLNTYIYYIYILNILNTLDIFSPMIIQSVKSKPQEVNNPKSVVLD